MADHRGTDYREVLATRVRERRHALGMSRSECARLSGLDPHHWGRLEGGTANLTLRSLLLVAHTLEVPAAELVDGLTLEHLPAGEARAFTRAELEAVMRSARRSA